MNGYWKRDEVSIEEAMGMAQELWVRCRKDIAEYSRYWARGGNAKMGLRSAPRVHVSVWFSPWTRGSGVTLERQGLKESMSFSPAMSLLGRGAGWLSPRWAWRREPSRDGRTEDLARACESALESYRKKLYAGARLWR